MLEYKKVRKCIMNIFAILDEMQCSNDCRIFL